MANRKNESGDDRISKAESIMETLEYHVFIQTDLVRLQSHTQAELDSSRCIRKDWQWQLHEVDVKIVAKLVLITLEISYGSLIDLNLLQLQVTTLEALERQRQRTNLVLDQARLLERLSRRRAELNLQRLHSNRQVIRQLIGRPVDKMQMIFRKKL